MLANRTENFQIVQKLALALIDKFIINIVISLDDKSIRS